MTTQYSDYIITTQSLHLYYGRNYLEALTQYQRVVLQPNHYTSQKLLYLQQNQVSPLAYLSLGESYIDQPFNKPADNSDWQRNLCNTYWQTRFVYVASKSWREKVLSKAEQYIKQGFQGFLLDNLDVVDLFPEEKQAMMSLIAELRESFPTSYLLANRGFSLLPEMVLLVDGLIFEAFSTRWHINKLGETFHRKLPARDLKINSQRVDKLHYSGLDLYALDYAYSLSLTTFAKIRATYHNLISVISNRYITKID